MSPPISFGYIIEKVTRQITYPREWISSRQTNDGYSFWRRIFIVATQSADPLQVGGTTMLYSGILPYTAISSFNQIPNYWSIAYVTGTGIKEIPYDIYNLVGMMAAMPILSTAGDFPFGNSWFKQHVVVCGRYLSIYRHNGFGDVLIILRSYQGIQGSDKRNSK